MANINRLRIDVNSECAKNGSMNVKEIEAVVKAATKAGITQIKLAGNDPLERKDFKNVLKIVKSVEGIEEISLVTDGATLANCAKDLAKEGLNRVNINLNTLKYNRYENGCSGQKLEAVIEGINAATDSNLKPVKLNVRLFDGFNDDELLDFIQLTFQHEYQIKFIEAGKEECDRMECEAATEEELKKRLPALRLLPKAEDDDSIDLYKYSAARGTICFVAPEKEEFTKKSKTIYLTNEGMLKATFEDNTPINIMGTLDDEETLIEKIKEVMARK